MGNIIDKKRMYELKMASQDNLAIFDSFTKAESVLDNVCVDNVLIFPTWDHDKKYLIDFCSLINKTLMSCVKFDNPKNFVEDIDRYGDFKPSQTIIITNDRNIEDSYTTDQDACFIGDHTPKIYRPLFWYRDEDFRDFRELMKIMMFKG